MKKPEASPRTHLNSAPAMQPNEAADAVAAELLPQLRLLAGGSAFGERGAAHSQTQHDNMTPGGQSPMCWRSPKILTHVLAITKNTNPLSHRTTTDFVYLCYTSLVGDGHHQKYECDTNFFVCLLVHRYRIDALSLPLVWFALHCGFKNRYLPCVTNTLINARQHPLIAQLVLRSCGSRE